LQEFIGIFEKISQLVALRTQSLGGKLGRDLYSGNGRVFRHIANFVYLNGGFSGERAFELLRKRSRFGIAGRKGAYEPGKLRLGEIRSKMNTGDAGCRKQLGKAAFRGSRSERNTVQQDLRSRCA